MQNDTDLPAIAIPPVPTRIATSTEQAIELYKTFRFTPGITAGTTPLAIDPTRHPHALLSGGVGSGKSVVTRTLIEDARTEGWMVFVVDGKGVDHEGLRGQANVAAVSQSVPDHLRVVRMVADELRARIDDAKRRRAFGEATILNHPPLLLVIDDIQGVRYGSVQQYGNDRQLIDDLKFLTRVGREFKVHIIIAAQEAYRSTITGQVLANIGLVVSVGPPADKTIREVIPEKLQDEATRIGDAISKSGRGRALAVMRADDGTSRVVEFQAYRGYAPGDRYVPADEALAEQWRQIKAASDKIPNIHPRRWFAVDSPDYGADLDQLYSLPTVMLDRPDGTPDPDMVHYDPSHPAYRGASRTATAQPASNTENTIS